MSIESMLGVPQAYANWQKKSVQGLSLSMIGMWFLGDFALISTTEFISMKIIVVGVVAVSKH